jgi:arylsulfatase A-like enzyme
MFERGIWAHTTPTLYEPILHVPLLIWAPGENRRRDVYTPTSCVDLLPTLAHLSGKAVPDWAEGEALPGFGGVDGRTGRSLFAIEAKDNSMRAPLKKATVALIKGRYKLIHYLGYDGYEDEHELYDLEEDPDELMNLSPFKTSVASDLRDELLQMLGKADQLYR